MSMIDDIEKELKEISPWPWRVDGNYHLRRAGDAELYHLVDDAMYRATNIFIAQSPEHIAALVEYVRAAEACMNRPLYLMLGESFSEHKQSQLNKWQALEAARRKLGLE